MNKNYLNNKPENNFTSGRNNDIIEIYNKIKGISERNSQNNSSVQAVAAEMAEAWEGKYGVNGIKRHPGPDRPEYNKPGYKPFPHKPKPLPHRPEPEPFPHKPKPLPHKPKPLPLPHKPKPEPFPHKPKPLPHKPKPILLYIPKEKKEQDRLKRATGVYNLERIDSEKLNGLLRLKEKTPYDYYSLSVPHKELNKRLDNEAFGPKTDFSVWNFENNFDKLNKEEQSMLIHKMQLALNNEGYKDYNGYSLKTDGIFGDKTKAAYKKYRENNNSDYLEAIENKILSSETPKEQKRNMIGSAVTEPVKFTLNSNKTDGKENSDADKKTGRTFRDWLESGEENKAELDAKRAERKEKYRQELTEIITDIVETGNSLFQKLMPQTHDAGKQVQRSIWKFGAEKYLRDQLKCYTSAWMLEHSLQDNPEKVVRDNNSAIAYKINNSEEYLKKLDEAIANSEDGVIDIDLKNIAFSDRDLYFSLHKATIHVKGYKAEDGHWYISATLSDTYDFTEILFLENGMSKQKIIGTLANDGAFVSQLTDAITPYEVEVNFYTRR